jgi:hypothetical protein
MGSKLFRYSGILLMILGFTIISVAAFQASVEILLFGIVFMLVSAVYFIIILSFDLFRRDKQLDYSTLTEAGLTIVECRECHKKNVLEDKYCIFCGEKLVNEDESI